ncbi:MAG: aconitase X catalytic domain-containing protein [Chloroflexota bacterium]
MVLQLTERDQQMLNGDMGRATQIAMRILTTMAQVYDADNLLDITSAHIDGVLYHGLSGLEFVQKLVEADGQVRVPTTLNVGALDLIHPNVFAGEAQVAEYARQTMQYYEQLGCQPIYTCTPYQTMARPKFGEQIAWAESNAIVFANSVLGARTQRYGDFIDICCALTGRAPNAGLHVTEHRRGQILYRLENIPEPLLREDVLFPVLGYLIGADTGNQIPVIEGLLPETTEDQLKAFGAATASSGSVGLFHAIGITPEAHTFDEAFQGHSPEHEVIVTMEMLRQVRDSLATAPDGNIDAVALGSPHFSLAEFEQLLSLVEAHPPQGDIEFIVCTNRIVLAILKQRNWLERLKSLGITVIVDTCVVVTPIIRLKSGVLMTNSGKFAHYAPGNIGLATVYGSLLECVRSASTGHVWRDESLW